MIVQELITELEKLDPTLVVLVRGYEGGANTIVRLAQYRAAPNADDAWYYGEFELAEGNDPEAFNAVELVGGRGT